MEAEAGLSPRLTELDEKGLVELGWASMRKGNARLLKDVGLELARRARTGSLTRVRDAYRIMRRAGTLDRETLSLMIATDPSLSSAPEADANTVARAVGIAGSERGGEILAKRLRDARPGEAEDLVSKVPPEALWAVKSHSLDGWKGELLDAASRAAASLRSALRYMEGGGEGWRELGYSMALEAISRASRLGESASIGGLSRATVFGMAETAIAILELESSRPGDPERVYSILSRLALPAAVKVLRSLYSRASADEREVLVRSMEKLLYKYSVRHGLRLLPKTVLSPRRSPRVDVRRSIYQSIRGGRPTIVYRERLRAGRLSLALDVSSSMIDYSSWAIAVASLFLSNISRLVFFSHTSTVLEGPLSRREVARSLLSVEFRGYTDISTALEKAAQPGVKKVVAVSDLQQTVDSQPIPHVVKNLHRSGYRVAFITPPSARPEDVEAVREAGARVVTAWTPRQAALGVLRHILRRP